MSRVAQNLELLQKRLPDWLRIGMYRGDTIRVFKERKNEALGYADVIGLNNHKYINALTVDIDRPDLTDVRNFESLPMPNVIVADTITRTFHLIYILKDGLPLGEGSPCKPIFPKILQSSLSAIWQGDPAFGLQSMTKNPFDEENKRYYIAFPNREPWELSSLRCWIDDDVVTENLHRATSKNLSMDRESFIQLGRNCRLFENLRKWAYKTVRSGGFSLQKVMERASELNTEGLPFCEVKATANSVFKWVSKNMSKEEFMAWSRSSRIRANKKRAEKKETKIELFARLWHDDDTVTIEEAGRAVGVSLRTAQTYAKIVRERAESAEQQDLFK